jgi:hypothetical protein
MKRIRGFPWVSVLGLLALLALFVPRPESFEDAEFSPLYLTTLREALDNIRGVVTTAEPGDAVAGAPVGCNGSALVDGQQIDGFQNGCVFGPDTTACIAPPDQACECDHLHGRLNGVDDPRPNSCGHGCATCIGNPTMEPETPTACGAAVTQCSPFTHCADADFRCPAPTQWPDGGTLRTRCPTPSNEQPTVCPTSHTRCPIVETRCPAEGDRVPTMCPLTPTRCPQEETSCPRRSTTCPAIATRCPKAATQCPRKTTKCPDTATNCPKEKTICPTKATKCPANATSCPRQGTVCPAVATACPREKTVCPAIATKCATDAPTRCTGGSSPTVCPVNATMCGTGATTCPVQATACPVRPTQCPPAATNCPPVPTNCPQTPTACVKLNTVCPAAPTNCPVFTVCPNVPGACPPPPTSQDIVINELMWDGTDASAEDEYVELRNLTDAVVDIGDWRIEKNGITMVTIPAGKTIAAFGLFLIANFDENSASSRLDVPPDVVTTDVDLDNANVQYKLIDAGGAIRDLADDGKGRPLRGKGAKEFVAMERNDPPGDGTKAASWHDAATQTNFDAGLPNPGVPLGTPRADNVP